MLTLRIPIDTAADVAAASEPSLVGVNIAAAIFAVLLLAVIGIPVKREHDRYVDTFKPEPRGRHRVRSGR